MTIQMEQYEMAVPPPLPDGENNQEIQSTPESWDFSGSTEIQGATQGVVPAQRRNRPTPEGRTLGAQVARLCDQEEAKQAKLARPTIPERCRTCAFRGGTIPNGCTPTLMDALKAIAEGDVDFLCHEHGRKGQLCAGAQLMKFDQHVTVDWPYSDELAPLPHPQNNPEQR